MKQLIAICACLLTLGGCTWDDWVAADRWLDSKVKVRNSADGPFSHKAMYENSIADPYMTPMNN